MIYSIIPWYIPLYIPWFHMICPSTASFFVPCWPLVFPHWHRCQGDHRQIRQSRVAIHTWNETDATLGVEIWVWLNVFKPPEVPKSTIGCLEYMLYILHVCMNNQGDLLVIWKFWNCFQAKLKPENSWILGAQPAKQAIDRHIRSPLFRYFPWGPSPWFTSVPGKSGLMPIQLRSPMTLQMQSGWMYVCDMEVS